MDVKGTFKINGQSPTPAIRALIKKAIDEDDLRRIVYEEIRQAMLFRRHPEVSMRRVHTLRSVLREVCGD